MNTYDVLSADGADWSRGASQRSQSATPGNSQTIITRPNSSLPMKGREVEEGRLYSPEVELQVLGCVLTDAKVAFEYLHNAAVTAPALGRCHRAVRSGRGLLRPAELFRRGRLGSRWRYARQLPGHHAIVRHRAGCETRPATARRGRAASRAHREDRRGARDRHRAVQLRAQFQTAPGMDPRADQPRARLVLSCGKCSNGEEFAPFSIKLNPANMIYEAEPEFDPTGSSSAP